MLQRNTGSLTCPVHTSDAAGGRQSGRGARKYVLGRRESQPVCLPGSHPWVLLTGEKCLQIAYKLAH